MADNKQRLRPWLVKQIDSRSITGLYWLNDSKTRFRMPWLHKGKQDWNPEFCKLFEEWEKNNGRYQPGVNEPNYPLWKTRMRCALHKSHDFKLIEEGQNDSYRIYELMPKEEKKSPGNVKSGSHRDEMDSIYSDDSQTQQSFIPQQPCIPIAVAAETYNSGEIDLKEDEGNGQQQQAEGDYLPADLKDLKSGELISLNGEMDLVNVSIDSVEMLSGQLGSLGLADTQSPVRDLRTGPGVPTSLQAGNEQLYGTAQLQQQLQQQIQQQQALIEQQQMFQQQQLLQPQNIGLQQQQTQQFYDPSQLLQPQNIGLQQQQQQWDLDQQAMQMEDWARLGFTDPSLMYHLGTDEPLQDPEQIQLDEYYLQFVNSALDTPEQLEALINEHRDFLLAPANDLQFLDQILEEVWTN